MKQHWGSKMFNACLRPIALYFLVMLPVVVLKFIEDKICVVSYSSINVELQSLQLIIQYFHSLFSNVDTMF